jgi:major membrane immunogen (membrane-anchored lipoprotein)
MKKRWLFFGALAAVLALAAIFMTGCSNGAQSAMKDGYYTAEMAELSRGWKEYVTICVNGGSIASVEYNAVNASGFIKAWDMAYMRNMGVHTGMYPNRYTREYARQLVENQSADGIDTVSGATTSGGYFRLLADAVIRQAMLGDDDVAIVGMPEESGQSATAQPAAAQAATPAVTPTSAPAATPVATPAPTPVVTPTAAPAAMPASASVAAPAPTPVATPTPAATSAVAQPAQEADAVSSATVPDGNS